MKARLVTGYVPIKDHPRSVVEYGELGERLGGVPVPKKAFYSLVEATWMHRYLKSVKYPVAPSAGDNPAKNTVGYHCVNHEKTTWLARAAVEYPDDILVWVDYGIFHQPGICNEAIVKFMESLDADHIYAPGCWFSDDFAAVESAHPCWRFCGSVLAVPARFAAPLDFECRAKARQHIQATNNVEWEVNTWARVERGKRSLPWRWYQADHNVSMFNNCPTLGAPDAA